MTQEEFEIIKETDDYVVINFNGMPLQVKKMDHKRFIKNEILGQVERVNFKIKDK